MSQKTGMSAVVEGVIFRNDENGYIVISVLPDGETMPVTAVGYAATPPAQGETVEMEGEFTLHPIYGRQFSASVIYRKTPTTMSGIEKYLSSGVIKGLGEKLARRVAEMFGEDTFDVIESAPERLAEVKGLPLKKALSIGEQFRERADERRAVMFLAEYGVSPAYAIKIYNRYKDQTISVVKANPYRLADDVSGVGFVTADGIARRAGFAHDDPRRVSGGIKYALSQGQALGHVYLPADELIRRSRELLGAGTELIEECLFQLRADGSVKAQNVDGTEAYYLKRFWFAETKAAKRLLEIIAGGSEADGRADASARIADYIRRTGEELSEGQRRAVLLALTSGAAVITGGPGTGKTTTIKAIIELLTEAGHTVELAAPTGRAAKRMTEATGRPAKTMHRLLGIAAGHEGNASGDDVPEIDADVVIIDEMSMVDILLFGALVSAVGPGARLVLVGDADQLPSVGPGNVLKDIIASEVVPVARLTDIYRQAAESAIVLNAHRVNRGEYPEWGGAKDFFFIRRQGAERVASAVVELAAERLPKFVGGDRLRDIQVLTPTRKGPLGVGALNATLQSALNPPGQGRSERHYGGFDFREGDKVMQIRNNYSLAWRIPANHCENSRGRSDEEGLGVYNGDLGIIEAIDAEGGFIGVTFDDGKTARYGFSALDELEPAYAMTIHKSQGSEVKAVILPMFPGPPMLLTRNLLYTAITRAERLCVLVGDPDCMRRIVDNNRETVRYSALGWRLSGMSSYVIESGNI
ncbi:MAG: ATP-dependent RecD-like DNA helicase [Clostridiales bacterium]|nr:ATP-dependent RecD-like DNA helicase [Clostridiales bacterium]